MASRTIFLKFKHKLSTWGNHACWPNLSHLFRPPSLTAQPRLELGPLCAPGTELFIAPAHCVVIVYVLSLHWFVNSWKYRHLSDLAMNVQHPSVQRRCLTNVCWLNKMSKMVAISSTEQNRAYCLQMYFYLRLLFQWLFLLFTHHRNPRPYY